MYKAQYAYAKRNPDKVKKWQEAWREANKEKRAKYNREWKKKNKDKVKKAAKKSWKRYYKKNRDVYLKKRWEYRRENLEKVRLYEKGRRKGRYFKPSEGKRLQRSNGGVNGVSHSRRFKILERDGFTCRYCGRKPPEVVLEVDHIVPKSKKGTGSLKNLITSCRDCNVGKSDK